MGCPTGGGVQHVDLNGNGIIRTTISDLAVNSSYTLSFWNRTHHVLTTTESASANVRVYDGSGNMLNQGWTIVADAAGDTWTQRSYTFTATSTSATLEFSGTATDNSFGGILIDAAEIVHISCTGSTLEYTQDCNDFTFSFSSPNIEIRGGFWTLDGVETTIGSDAVNLSGGSHEICYSYVGFDKVSNVVCCNTVCVTVDAPDFTTYDPETVTYCELFGGYAYNPCTGVPYTQYSIKTLPDNGDGASIIPCNSPIPVLPEGSYLIEYYDANGCVRASKLLTVEQQDLVTHSCEMLVYDDCYTPVDPAGIMPDQSICSDCYNVAVNATSTSLGNLIGTSANGYPLYLNVYTDENTCEVCSLTVELQPGPCNFELDFNVLEDPMNPNTYYFNVGITPNYPYSLTQCVDQLIVTDNGTSNIVYSGVLPSNIQLNPGNYTLCWTVGLCDNSCSPAVQCNKTICETITVTTPIPQGGGSGTGSGNDADGLGGSLDDFIGVKLIPNPSSSKFKIVKEGYDGAQYDQVIVYAADGKKVIEKSKVDVNTEFDLSDQAPGTYLIQVVIKGKTYKQKLSLTR